jgi:hypothetical protein
MGSWMYIFTLEDQAFTLESTQFQTLPLIPSPERDEWFAAREGGDVSEHARAIKGLGGEFAVRDCSGT